MVYKEWRQLRLKMLMLAGIYTLIGVLVYVTQITIVHSYNTPPMLLRWFNYSFFATIGAAVFFGVDIIAEEKNSGTLGFLLARPISRSRIYLTKILLNLCGLAVIFLVSSVILFFINTIPKAITLEEYQQIDGIYTIMPPVQIYLNPVGFGYALDKTAVTLILGLCFVCISGLISIFARTLLESLSLNVVIVAVLFLSLNARPAAPYYLEIENQNELFIIVSMALLTVWFLWAGLFFFQRKEF